MDASTATVLAACIAAALALSNLIWSIVSDGRRSRDRRDEERTKWMRDRLHQDALIFLDAAFAISGRSSDAQKARAAGLHISKTQPILDRVHREHTTLRDSLTGLRLLAPADVIEAAEKVHDSHHDVINCAFGEPDPMDKAEWERLKEVARNDRAAFLTALRAPLGLDPHAASIGAKAQSSWKTPANRFDAVSSASD